MALSFPDLEIWGKQPRHEEDGCDDTDQENWPFCPTVIYRAEGKDQCGFDAAVEDTGADGEDGTGPCFPIVCVVEALRPGDEG